MDLTANPPERCQGPPQYCTCSDGKKFTLPDPGKAAAAEPDQAALADDGDAVVALEERPEVPAVAEEGKPRPRPMGGEPIPDPIEQEENKNN